MYTVCLSVNVFVIFLNGRKFVSIQQILEKLSHPQPPILIKMNNSTVSGIANNNIVQK